jgi:hypothetical protein
MIRRTDVVAKLEDGSSVLAAAIARSNVGGRLAVWMGVPGD